MTGRKPVLRGSANLQWQARQLESINALCVRFQEENGLVIAHWSTIIGNKFYALVYMRHSLLILMLLAMCEPLAVVTDVAAVDPPSAQRISFENLSSLLQEGDSRTGSPASCASAACHGGPRPGIAQAAATRGAEYPLWLARDPHAQAFRSLSNELGTQILQRLKILEGSEIVNRTAFNNCLACHNSSLSSLVNSDTEYRMEGVACDRCHGPSRDWNKLHYTGEWPAWVANDQASHLGFVDNHDLLTRARMCASCHIGDGQRNMNHDMIAAGHPPLLYEFTTYHNRLPKHWRDRRSQDREHYEATLWFVGQVAALEAQTALIQTRAATIDQRNIEFNIQHSDLHSDQLDQPLVWPEFAHLDCAGCHKPIGNSRTVNSSTAPAQWSRWNRWGIELMLDTANTSTAQTAVDEVSVELKRALSELEDALKSPNPNRSIVSLRATALKQATLRWVDGDASKHWLEHSSATRLQKLLAGSLAQLSQSNDDIKPNWESLSQLYLAGLATRAQWPSNRTEPSDRNVQSLADQLRKQLLFSPNKAVPDFQIQPTANDDAMAFLKALQQSRSRERP